MKKSFLILASAATLCACTGNIKNMNQVKDTVWTQDPMNMCSALIEQNKAALDTVRAKYGTAAAEAVKPLYQDLDLQSNAVCRSRIVSQDQVSRLQELRAEYLGQIEEILKEYK